MGNTGRLEQAESVSKNAKRPNPKRNPREAIAASPSGLFPPFLSSIRFRDEPVFVKASPVDACGRRQAAPLPPILRQVGIVARNFRTFVGPALCAVPGMVPRASPTVQKLGNIDMSLNLNATWNEFHIPDRFSGYLLSSILSVTITGR
jgi:hypothetical protein